MKNGMAKAVIQKNWYEIQVPDIFDAEEITETPAEK
ncbi:MAG: ribosomal protein S3AE, partial [Candidatus Nanohaloarchaea archaeon]